MSINHLIEKVEIFKPRKAREIIEKYGYDWSNIDIDWSELDLSEENLTQVTIPRTVDFFQNIEDKNIIRAILPEGDYSMYDFKNVNILGVIFPNKSFLPKNKELFQLVEARSIALSKMPPGDYSEYNFKGVDIYGTKFTRESKLPENKSFLRELNTSLDENGEPWKCVVGEDFILPHNVVRNIHYYDLEGFSIDLGRYSELLTEEQLSVIKIKYKDLIGDKILLPDKGLYKEENINKDNKYELNI